MDVPEDMVESIAKILAHLDSYRERGLVASLEGPPARVLVAGYHSVFLAEAHRSAQRANEAHSAAEPALEAGASAATILCAVAACEAYLSEYLAQIEFADGQTSDEILAIRNDPDAGRQWKALLRSKAPVFKPGDSKEYLSLGCLLEVRDLTAHRNARTLPVGEFPANLADCVRQRVVPVRQAKDADWTSVVFVSEVASWAATTADAWLTLVDGILPRS